MTTMLVIAKIKFYFLFPILIPVLTQSQVFAVEASKDLPKIKFEHLGNNWQNISTTASKKSIYSTRGDDLFLSCQASYPIRWNITGVIRPVEIVKILPPQRDLLANLFKIRLNIFFVEAEKFPGLIASALIACESVEDSTTSNGLAVFVRGNNPLVEPLEDKVTDSNVIPCPTSEPTTSISLYIKNSEGSEALVQDVKYNPITGFTSENIFSGIYVCRKGTFSITVSASKTNSSENLYSPLQNNIRHFTDEILEFKCSSKSKKVNLIFLPNNVTTVVFTQNADKTKAAQLALAANVLVDDDTVINGKVACVADDDKTLIHEWSYELIKNPELYLDNIEGEADCLSGITPKIVQSVRCINSMDCAFMSQCLRNPLFCNFKKQKQFYAQTDTYCWVDEQNKGRSCVSVPFSHLNGLVQCSVRGISRKWEYFISLDYLRYSNWNDAPQRELVRLEELEQQGSTLSGNSTFLCTASAYLFADSLIFQLKYANGTKEFIRGQDKEKEFSRPSSQSPRKIYELNVKALVNIKLEADVVSVNCIAPFWNTTDYLTVTKLLNNKNIILTPNCLHALQEGVGNVETFQNGEHNKELSCLSEKAYKIWQYADHGDVRLKAATERFPELKVRSGMNHSLSLIFPVVEKRHAGVYMCVASENDKLSIIKEYKLNVLDHLETASATYIGLVVILIIIALLTVIAVAIFLRKERPPVPSTGSET